MKNLDKVYKGSYLKKKMVRKLEFPHIGFSANLDYLNEFVNRLYNKFEKIKKE